MKSKYSLLIFILMVFVISCSPTMKNQTTKFEGNLKKIENLIRKYPSFKTLLTELYMDATEIFEESKKANSSRDKVFKVVEANSLIINNSFFKALYAYELFVRRVENKRNVLRIRESLKYRNNIQKAMAITRDKLYEASDLIENANPHNDREAMNKIDKACEILLYAESVLEDTKKMLDEEEDESTD